MLFNAKIEVILYKDPVKDVIIKYKSSFKNSKEVDRIVMIAHYKDDYEKEDHTR